MENLSSKQRQYLVKLGHSLKPVIIVGKGGLSEGLSKAVANALKSHELIKIRFNEMKEVRREAAKQLAEELEVILVRITGNTALLFKENENVENRKIFLPN